MDGADTNLGLVHLVQRILESLNGALNVSFDDEVEFLDVTVSHGVKEVLEGNVLNTVLLFNTSLKGALISKLTSVALLLEDAELIACARNGLQTKNLNCIRRTSGSNCVALRIKHCADASKCHTSNKSVADVECTACDQNSSNRAATTVKLSLKNVTRRKGVWIGLQFKDICLQKNGLEKIVDAQILLSGDINKHVLSAPLLRNNTVLGELLTNTGRICAWLINLVDCNNNWNTSSLCVVDRLNGLRHNTVVCSNNQDDNIGDLCTTSTHCGKGLVTWGIDEGNLTAVNGDLRSTDCLSNAASLASCNASVTDCVQK